MADEKKLTAQAEEKAAESAKDTQEISETWAQDIIEDLDDWIESQGIYLRQ